MRQQSGPRKKRHGAKMLFDFSGIQREKDGASTDRGLDGSPESDSPSSELFFEAALEKAERDVLRWARP
jgi:hypothetical protein